MYAFHTDSRSLPLCRLPLSALIVTARFCIDDLCEASFLSGIPKWTGSDAYNLMLAGSTDIPEPLLSSTTPTAVEFDYGTGLQLFISAPTDPVFEASSEMHLPITRQLYRHPLTFFQRKADTTIVPQARGLELLSDDAAVGAATMTGMLTIAVSSFGTNSLLLLVGGTEGRSTSRPAETGTQRVSTIGGTSLWISNQRLHLAVFDGDSLMVETSSLLPTDLAPHHWIDVVFTVRMSTGNCQVRYDEADLRFCGL